MLSTTHLSLFQNVSSVDVIDDPYPHVVVQDALPDALHSELRKTFPEPETVGVDSRMDNQRWSIMARDLPRHLGVSTLWQQFVQFHASEGFWAEIVRVFGPRLTQLHPERFANVVDLNNTKVALRDPDRLDSGVLSLDAQISGNTPARTAGSPRGVHTDDPNSLYAGLYYLRATDDDSVGGDLEIWKWREGYSFRKKSSVYQERVPLKHVEHVKTVPYRSNTFVFLLNSIDALHAVTVRQPSSHRRQFLNLLADTTPPFFEYQYWTHVRLLKSLHHHMGRWRIGKSS